MDFKELYRMHVVSDGKAGTTEAVGEQLIKEYLQDKGTTGERFVRAYIKLDDMFRECGCERSPKNLGCFVLCYDLLRTEAGRK